METIRIWLKFFEGLFTLVEELTFGDNKDLAKMLIFAGDNEIFHKDIVSYVEKLEEDGVDVKFVVSEGMFHIYPLFPSPEARAAFKIIKEELED